MTKKAGLWIDHRKAVLVFLDGKRVWTKTLESEVEPRIRLAGGARGKTPYAAQDVASEGNRDRRILGELHAWYRDVMTHLGELSDLLVIGPGQAKKEFVKEFQAISANLDVRLILEPADKMREHDIVEHVRHVWGQPKAMFG